MHILTMSGYEVTDSFRPLRGYLPLRGRPLESVETRRFFRLPPRGRRQPQADRGRYHPRFLTDTIPICPPFFFRSKTPKPIFEVAGAQIPCYDRPVNPGFTIHKEDKLDEDDERGRGSIAMAM